MERYDHGKRSDERQGIVTAVPALESMETDKGVGREMGIEQN